MRPTIHFFQGKSFSNLNSTSTTIFAGEIPENLQQIYWMSYFPAQMTNGFAVYMDTKSHFKEAIFQRRAPLSKKCSAFIMDELDIDKMIGAINEERYFFLIEKNVNL